MCALAGTANARTLQRPHSLRVCRWGKHQKREMQRLKRVGVLSRKFPPASAGPCARPCVLLRSSLPIANRRCTSYEAGNSFVWRLACFCIDPGSGPQAVRGKAAAEQEPAGSKRVKGRWAPRRGLATLISTNLHRCFRLCGRRTPNLAPLPRVLSWSLRHDSSFTWANSEFNSHVPHVCSRPCLVCA